MASRHSIIIIGVKGECVAALARSQNDELLASDVEQLVADCQTVHNALPPPEAEDTNTELAHEALHRSQHILEDMCDNSDLSLATEMREIHALIQERLPN